MKLCDKAINAKKGGLRYVGNINIATFIFAVQNLVLLDTSNIYLSTFVQFIHSESFLFHQKHLHFFPTFFIFRIFTTVMKLELQ